MDLKKTHLYEYHKEHGKLVDFGGFEMPVWFEGIIPEHHAVRNAVGIFDTSHMAPEQFLGKATFKSDVYSIGCIFYEMLIGRPPIFDPDPFKILEKAKLGKITPPRLKNTQIPKEVDRIIMKCLATKVEERYENPAQIVKDISKFKGKDARKSEIDDIRGRIKARELRKSHQCWNCRRPLPYKAQVCPHCGERHDAH